MSSKALKSVAIIFVQQQYIPYAHGKQNTSHYPVDKHFDHRLS
jgi:hypothetical protein